MSHMISRLRVVREIFSVVCMVIHCAEVITLFCYGFIPSLYKLSLEYLQSFENSYVGANEGDNNCMPKVSDCEHFLKRGYSTIVYINQGLCVTHSTLYLRIYI